MEKFKYVFETSKKEKIREKKTSLLIIPLDKTFLIYDAHLLLAYFPSFKVLTAFCYLIRYYTKFYRASNTLLFAKGFRRPWREIVWLVNHPDPDLCQQLFVLILEVYIEIR